MEKIETPLAVFSQPTQIQPSISQWKLEREILEMYYETPEARGFIEELAGRLGLKISFERFREQLQRIEQFEKEVKRDG